MSTSRKQARPDVRQLDDGTECAISKTADNVNTNTGDPVRALTFTALNQNFLDKDFLGFSLYIPSSESFRICHCL